MSPHALDSVMVEWRMRSGFHKKLLVPLALASLIRADYYIDDQNYTSLLYSENPGGAKWGPFQEGGETISISLANGTMMTIDASQCFNYTYTYAACTIADDCQVQIPFTGSGITIYVLQAGPQGMNASLTIDGGAPKYKVLPAPPGPNFYIPNVALFSVQGIATGNHAATMTVLDWDNIFSGMMFDCVEINQTVVLPTTTISSVSSTAASTTSSFATASPSPSSPHSSTNIGAVVGGVIGDLIALAALFLATFYFRRRTGRKAQASRINIDAEPQVEPFMAEHLYRPSPNRYSDIPQPSTSASESFATGLPGSTQPPYSTGASASSLREKSRLGVDITNPSASRIASANAAASVSGASHTRPGSSSVHSPSTEASRPQIQQAHPMLSDDQADFVNTLYANNVPAAAVARVIERMIAGERRPVVDGYDSLPPPSYDHISGDA